MRSHRVNTFSFDEIINPLFELTSVKNIFKIGLCIIPVGLIQLSLIYYLSFTLLTPYYRTLEEAKFTGLNITQKVSLLGISSVIFSVFTGYVITKSLLGLLYLVFPALIIWILIKTIKEPITDIQERIRNLLNEPSSPLKRTADIIEK